MDSFRKAYGALKDSTKVGLAKVNSDFKDLDIAIVKATNHVECPPKERHVRKIFAAVSVHRPRADVAYCIHALSRRLAKTRNWIVAVKTLIVIHRTLREGDPSFREELIHYSQRGQLFPVSNFKDDSSTLAWDCSGWVRSYAHFLEERLECFRALNYDIETDRVTKSVRGISKAPSKTRVLNGDELLDQLPALQQLLFRLVGCQPEGAACHNFLIQFALALILKESFKIYCAINDGIINLVDTFFEMPKPDAVRALDIYKKAGRQAEHLADFYGFCRTLDLARTFHFPILKQAPASFLATMEEYIKEAPETKPVSNKKLEDKETEEEEPQKPEERPQEETKKQVEVVRGKGEIVNLIDDEPKSNTKEEIPPPVSTAQPVDLLSMDDVIPNQPALHDNNALALAIVEPANNPPTTHNALSEIGTATGWELALVTTPSNIDKPQVAQNKMAGGFDKLLLDSLYEDNTARKTLQLQSAGHQTSYGYEMPVQNPFDLRQDPFAMSNNVVPQTNMQMGFMSQHDQMAMMQYQRQMMMYQQQQQQMMMPHQQQNMMMPHYQYAAQYSQQQMPQMGAAPASNPFADSFNYPQNAMPPYGNHRIL